MSKRNKILITNWIVCLLVIIYMFIIVGFIWSHPNTKKVEAPVKETQEIVTKYTIVKETNTKTIETTQTPAKPETSTTIVVPINTQAQNECLAKIPPLTEHNMTGVSQLTYMDESLFRDIEIAKCKAL